MEYLAAFLFVMVVIFIGEWVSSFSKAYIPSVFITAILFLIGFWTHLIPEDITIKASFGKEFAGVGVMLLLVHLGTIMNLKELLSQWRAVTIALAGTVGTILMTMAVGTVIYDWHTVVAAIPPLTGGLVAALLMSDGLKAAGLTTLVALPIAMFISHSLIGYPLTSVMLKKEGRRLLKEFHETAPSVVDEHELEEIENAPEKKLFNIPEKYQTSAFMLARVALVAVLAALFAQLLHNKINPNVVALIFGVVAHQVGFLENNVLNKAGVFNWLMYGLLAYIFSQLSVATPKILGGILIQIIVLIVLGIIGMYIMSAILAKPMKMSRPMAFATALTAMFGFPADYILTNEVAQNLASTELEKEYLLEHMMPKMLVGGFATVSVASIIISSIFLELL